MENAKLPENVANCEQERIHALGLIQPHGALLGFSQDGALVARSANASEMLGTLPSPGFPLSDDNLDQCARVVIARALHNRHSVLESLEWASPSGERFDLVMHWSGDTLIAEFEQIVPDAPSASQFALFCQRAIGQLQVKQYGEVAELLQDTAEAIRSMTGFDRVMGYRFLGDGSGEVIAEARPEGLLPYLHQRYPASDIPAQARRLYVLNPIRQIASVDNQPVAITPDLNPDSNAPLDLSHSVLRSVSAVHIEYLKNMGVSASMSVSIIINGKLWGLFACHHMKPYRASHAVRLSCTVLTQVVSILVSQIEARRRLANHHRTQKLSQHIASELSHAEDLVAGLSAAAFAIVELVDCDCAFAVVDQEVIPLHCPGVSHRAPLAALSAYMTETRTDFFETNSWARDVASLEPIQTVTGVFPGCLAVNVGGDVPITIIWLRDELVETIRWAGPPGKVVSQGPNGPRLTPRGSFEVWKQIVRESSREWSEVDQRAARELRTVLQATALQRMREGEQARTTLLATLGHDLRNPLQAINMAMLLMGRGLASSTDTARRVEGSTQRMQSLINYILDVSRIRSGLGLGLTKQLVRLKDVIESTVEQNRLAHPGVTISSHLTDDIGDAFIDPDRFGQALTNLISNARQHGDIAYPIELTVSADASGQIIEVSNRLRERPNVTFDRLLDPFKSGSLNNPNNRGGMGLGLFIANAIVRGHDAKLEGRFDQTHAHVSVRLAPRAGHDMALDAGVGA
ncbi:GAF domain-containing protein [Caballeronia sp. GAWG1-1]|uniref:GAF domain-containing protein n=1 Tax=Caballeronia sp. GAWG1-1 TaxID=2921742 RepID=UPI0020287E1D|nr:GAF domain-containing protein [Caballeronia sp. GAWG1-1]